MRSPLLAAAALVLSAALPGQAGAAPSYVIRWVQIHEPITTAERAASDFAARVEKATGGDVRVEVLTKSQYEKRQGRTMSNVGVMRSVAAGKGEMCQIYTHSLVTYSRDLMVLGMPFLFRDYAHAEAVIEGPIGRRLVDGLPEDSALKALGIAYSGGFGVISTRSEPARRPEQLRGLRMLTSRFPFAAAIAGCLGIEPVVGPPDAYVPLAASGLADAAETTMQCFDMYRDDRQARAVADTRHFLLTSMFVINAEYFRKLPPKYRDVIAREAWDAARQERRESVEINQAARVRTERRGVKVADLTPAEKSAFEAALRPQYGLLGPRGRRLADEIRAAAPAAVNAAASPAPR